MEIVFFINTLSSGGAEHQMSYLANFLDELGHNIRIVTFGDMPDHYPLNPSIERIRLAPHKSKIIKAFKIFLFFTKVKCDWVISFCQDNNLLSIPGLFFNPKRKLIVGERNCTLGGLTRLEKILFRGLYGRASFIVPNSHSQAAHIVKYVPELKNKIKVITNYTDTDRFINKKRKDDSGKKTFCIFAKYAPQKNCFRFAEVLRILKSEGIDIHVDWFGNKHLPGDKVNTYYMEFQEMIEKLGIQDMLTLRDKVNNVEEKMTQYDYFCLPSLFEGFSNALAEAICCGLPVLAGDVSDNGMMVEHGINGFLFNPLDTASMVDTFKSAIKLKDRDLDVMGRKSRDKACVLFNKEKFINSYLELIS